MVLSLHIVLCCCASFHNNCQFSTVIVYTIYSPWQSLTSVNSNTETGLLIPAACITLSVNTVQCAKIAFCTVPPTYGLDHYQTTQQPQSHTKKDVLKFYVASA